MLKKGAQVMFVRNDNSTEKHYFNGKIGRITRIDKYQIRVKCPDDKVAITLEKVTWDNIKYTINPENKAITAEIIGKFIQYPLRLAWAITIHKSQGLTFERAIIDANAAFAHGQVYVALSRCKTFSGMVLSSPIAARAIKSDTSVAQYDRYISQNLPTLDQLLCAKILYQHKLLLECFDFQNLSYLAAYLIQKSIKIDSKQISFELHQAGKNIEQIAKERGMVVSTIENHLGHYIGIGQLNVTDFIDEKKLLSIENKFAEMDDDSLSPIKNTLGDGFSYGEIRMVKKYLAYKSRL